MIKKFRAQDEELDKIGTPLHRTTIHSNVVEDYI